MHIRKLTVAMGAAAIIGTTISTPVLAQDTTQERLKDVARRAIGQAPLPQINETVGRASYDSGATHWISPLLRNAPGTIGGEHYTINGKRLTRNFELSVINPSAEHAVAAYVGCYNAGGAYLSRYAQSFTVPPSGAVNWNSSSATPPATTDGASEDVDNVWCVVGGDRPVAAFGWTVRQFGSEVSKYHFSLERAAPAGR